LKVENVLFIFYPFICEAFIILSAKVFIGEAFAILM
jgi:hypothetical protein